jgi:glucosyl-3-phosphoglycerate synthase
MGDFYQNGIITTLHNLSKRPIDVLENELLEFSRQRPLGLILPSLYSELQGVALPAILEELVNVPYLSEIVIGLDRADQQQYREALGFFGSLPQRHRVLWNDGPRLQALDKQLQELDLAPKELGKGRNVWYCMGYTHPVAHPRFNYEFCKGFYSRVADGKINGRVSRLLVTPLLRALKKTLGDMEYLEYMDSFRYPLAGEFSFRRDVLNDILIPSDWGLEIGVLSEMYRNYANNRLCQADIADIYDHKHQDLSAEDDQGGLSKMSIDISKALFRKLATRGVTFNTEAFRSLKATYYRIALDFVETYHNDAVMNGLSLDIHNEEKAVELFAENIMKAGQAFLARPMERPFIPSWNRVISAVPNILQQLREAVEADHAEFSRG